MSQVGESSKVTKPVAKPIIATDEGKGSPRVNLPDTFSGHRHKLGQFILQYQMYLAFNQEKFAAESLKVLWIASLIRDTAAHWIEPALSDYLENRADNGACSTAMKEKNKVIFRTPEGFTTEIKKVFGDPNEVEQAEKHLLGVRQRASVHEYTAEFHRYSMRLEWTDGALRSMYYRGLKDHIKDEVARAEKADDLDELIKTATSIDERIQERQKEKRGYFAPTHMRNQTFHGKKRGSFQNNKYTSVQNHYDPMELDGAERRTKGHSEKQKQREKGLCFTCGKSGHLARDCSQGKSGPKTWSKPKREFGLAERKPAYRELAGAEREAPEEMDLAWGSQDFVDYGEGHTQEEDEVKDCGSPDLSDEAVDVLPYPYEEWSLLNHDDNKRTWRHFGSKPDFTEIYRTHDAPASSTKCCAIYRDRTTIVFRENEMAQTARTKRYTANLQEEPEPKEPGQLDSYLRIQDTWAIFEQTSKERYWQRRQPTSEIACYQRIKIDPIHGKAEFEVNVPYTLISYNQGLRRWLNETTGDIISEQRDVPKESVTDLELASTEEELDQLIIPVKVDNIKTKALIDSGAMGRFMNPAFVEKWNIQTTKNPRPYKLKLLGGKDAGEDGWVRRRTYGITMLVGGHEETINFDIIPTGRHDIVLGTLWLNTHNPSVDWVTQMVTFEKCHCRGS